MKVHSTIYKGIEYIQISTLPADQREKLLRTINPELLIKIQVDGKMINNCLQFKDYEDWFEGTYKIQPKVRIGENRKETSLPDKILRKLN